MKRIFSIFLAILMFASLPLFCPAEEKMVEHIKNGGFETLESDVKPANWGLDPGFTWGKDAVLETAKPYEGKYALRTKSDGLQFVQNLPAVPGKEYTLSFYLRADKIGDRSRIGFEVTSGGYKFDSHWLEPTSEWTRYEFKYVPIEGTSNFSIRMVQGKGNDLVWDALSLTTPDSPEYVQNEKLPAYGGAENMIADGGFEELDENGLPVHWEARKPANHPSGQSSWVDNPMAEIDDEFVHSGKNSLKLTVGEDGVIAFARTIKALPMNPNTRYQISAWVRSDTHKRTIEATRFWVRWEYYNSAEMNAKTIVGSGGTRCAAPVEYGRWEQFSRCFTPADKIAGATHTQVYFYLQPPAGTIWVDDVELVPVSSVNVMNFECDQYFYYEDAETGYAKVEMLPEYVDEYKDSTVDFIFYDKDGTTVLKEQKNIPLAEGKAAFSYPISFISEMKTAYPIRAVLRDAAGNEQYSTERRVYRYNRPTMMNEDGELLNEDGSIFVMSQSFGFHGNTPEQKAIMEDLGMNVGLSSMGYTGPYIWTNGAQNELKEVLDAVAANGKKIMVNVRDLKWTIGSSGHLDEGMKKMVEEFKDHPGVLAWYVMDEPFDMLSEPEIELEKAYKAVRDIDDKHPIWLVDNNIIKFDKMTKYADLIYPDPYPAWPQAKEPLFPEPYNTASANPAVHDSDMAQMVRREAERYGKGFGNTHQAFDYNGYNPVPAELRSFIYQSLFERAHGDSWFNYSHYMKKPDWIEFFSTYAKEEQGLLRELFGRASEIPLFNRFDCHDYSYQSAVKGGKLYMMIINRHAEEQTIEVSLRSHNGLLVASGNPEEMYLVGESVKPSVSGETLTVTIPAVNVSLIRLDAPDATNEKITAEAFDDLDGYDWAAEAIEKLYAKDILSADALRAYAPGKAITRGDFAKYLIRALDLELRTQTLDESFADVPEGSPYYREILVGKTLGILRGVGDNAYNPETPITRQDLMVICRRGLIEAFKATGDMADLSTFSDSALVADYAQMAVSTMNKAGIVLGNADGTLNPLGNTTRAEAAVIMERIMNIK